MKKFIYGFYFIYCQKEKIVIGGKLMWFVLCIDIGELKI